MGLRASSLACKSAPIRSADEGGAARSSEVVGLTVATAPESLHSVTLSVDGVNYTANIWRGSGTQWRVLSVEGSKGLAQ